VSKASATAAIRRPITDVFAVLTDVEQTGRWFPGDVEERWTSDPPHGVGATRHAVVRALGRTTENDAVVTAFVPPTLAAMRGTTPGAGFDATLTFSEANGLTRVNVIVDLRASGAMRVVMPAFARWYEGQWRRGLVTLTRLMESGEL
jgi:uncharacterized protein YndB with AHSA1/START domain